MHGGPIRWGYRSRRYHRPVTRHPFLSDPWIEAARELRQEYADQVPESPIETRINVIVTDVVHREPTTMEGHIDTTSGQSVIEHGHLDDPDLTITVDYDTARSTFVSRDPAAVMQAFLSGKIYVEGDASRLLALQAGGPADTDPVAIEMYEKLEAFTDPDA
jgi:hypothetical protein